MPDANSIAAAWERRERERESLQPDRPLRVTFQPNVGTFSYWEMAHDVRSGADPYLQTDDCFVQILDGLIVTTSGNGDREIIAPRPGSYACFVINRAGE